MRVLHDDLAQLRHLLDLVHDQVAQHAAAQLLEQLVELLVLEHGVGDVRELGRWTWCGWLGSTPRTCSSSPLTCTICAATYKK